MKKVTMNGVSYIGELEFNEKENKATLKNAMKIKDGIDRATISNYYKKKNIGELSTIEFGGKGTAFAVSKLLPEEQMLVKMADVVMEMAKGRALQTVENNIFDEFLGK